MKCWRAAYTAPLPAANDSERDRLGAALNVGAHSRTAQTLWRNRGRGRLLASCPASHIWGFYQRESQYQYSLYLGGVRSEMKGMMIRVMIWGCPMTKLRAQV